MKKLLKKWTNVLHKHSVSEPGEYQTVWQDLHSNIHFAMIISHTYCPNWLQAKSIRVIKMTLLFDFCLHKAVTFIHNIAICQKSLYARVKRQRADKKMPKRAMNANNNVKASDGCQQWCQSERWMPTIMSKRAMNANNNDKASDECQQ